MPVIVLPPILLVKLILEGMVSLRYGLSPRTNALTARWLTLLEEGNLRAQGGPTNS